MSDRLTLSCWLRGFGAVSALHHWEKLLRLFPYSRLSKQPTICRIHAVAASEPCLVEQEYPPPFDPQPAVRLASEFQHTDCAYEVETFWDLMLPEDNWSLRPAPISLWCFAPDYENPTTDHVRIEFGLETQFLPLPDDDRSLRASEANLKSLTHLVRDVASALPVERQHLWSESGINFAEKLEAAVSRGGSGLALQ
jgi:hypothetical protein